MWKCDGEQSFVWVSDIAAYRLTLHATDYSDIILVSKQLAIILLELS